MHIPTSLRRASAAIAATVLPLTVLAACGSDEASNGLDLVSVSGEFGQEPTVEFDGVVEPDGFASEVVIEGDGPAIETDDLAFVQIWIGNGYTGRKAFSTFEFAQPGVVPVSTDPPSALEKQTLQQSAVGVALDPVSGALPEALSESLTGVRGGSRVVVAADAESSFGELGQPNLNIGNQDGVVYVIDVLATIPDGPSGTEVAPPEGTPAVIEEGGAVTGLDFTGAGEPTGELQVIPLLEGDGPVVEEGATLVADYLGQVYQAEAPFDESYSRGLPSSFVVGGPGAQVIEGWNQGLVGLKAGSRVLLVIPPDLGYGEAGNEQAGITGTDTLYFVVDVLGSAVVPEPALEDPALEDPALEDPALEDPAAEDPTPTDDPAATPSE